MKRFLLPFLLSACCCNIATAQTITTIAGYGVGDGGIAVMAELYQPISVTLDTAGNVYFADPSQSTIRKINTAGIITTFAGTRVSGYNGDNIRDTFAQLNHPTGIKADVAGNIYIADYSNNRVRKINTAGIITTIAGTGAAGFAGDGGQATAAKLVHPSDIALDTSGNIYIADQGNVRIRKINRAGIITTYAGTGTTGFGGDGGQATLANMNFPAALALDDAGALYVVDNGNNAIRKIDTTHVITTIAGTGSTTGGYAGDGGPATAAVLSNPSGVSVDAGGNVYISDNANDRIRVINRFGVINTIAGTTAWGFSGDGGSATDARLHNPCGSAVDAAGNFYFADNANERVRKINTAGIISTIAGQSGTAGDGGPATSAGLSIPLRLAIDRSGNKYIVDYGNDRIKKIDLSGNILTIAGNGTIAHTGDGGPADSASIFQPSAIATDSSGNIFFTEQYGNTVREINTSGIITTVAGTGSFGFSGDGGAAVAATLENPAGLAFDRGGNLYIADLGNNRIRKIDASGTITTIAGTALAAHLGDGGPASAASLNGPMDVATDTAGNIYVADMNNNCIRKISGAGIISTIAGTTTAGFANDGQPATLAELNQPQGVAADSAGNIFIADYGNQRVRRIDTNGVMATLGGDGISGYSGDGGPAYRAELYSPTGVTIGTGRVIYIADSYNNKIRKIDSSSNYLTSSITSIIAPAWDAILFPNPATDVLHISIAASLLPGTVSITNATGQVVLTNDLLFANEAIGIGSLPPGLYLVRVTCNSGSSKVIKLVK